MARLRPPAHAAALALAGAAVIGAPALAAPKPSNPTPKQIKAAIHKATTSGHLWATINACAPKGHPHLLSVRGQMPALGFPARLSTVIQIDYWNVAQKRFLPDSKVAFTNRLGVVSFGFEQGGHNFIFNPHAGRLRATVTFMWRRSGVLLGSTSRTTTAGHHDALFAHPKGYSAATCTLA
jgi:hypothetical protein